jgi:hypothetical protein
MFLQLLLLLAAVEGFVSPSISLSERVKRHILQASPLDISPQSDVLLGASTARGFTDSSGRGFWGAFDVSSSSLWVADGGVGSPYESSGVPIWVPLVAATALALTLASPLIARSLQRKANTRRLDTSFPPEDDKL